MKVDQLLSLFLSLLSASPSFEENKIHERKFSLVEQLISQTVTSLQAAHIYRFDLLQLFSWTKRHAIASQVPSLAEIVLQIFFIFPYLKYEFM